MQRSSHPKGLSPRTKPKKKHGVSSAAKRAGAAKKRAGGMNPAKSRRSK